jgi:hypothetical protein
MGFLIALKKITFYFFKRSAFVGNFLYNYYSMGIKSGQ